MKVITFANQKGGVGKTTTVTSLAYALNRQGCKTLLIDADEQCNSTDTYRAQTEGVATIYDLILDEEPCTAEEAIQHTEYGDIIAGDVGLASAERILSSTQDYLRLKKALQTLDEYQFVIIDTHPSVNSVLYNALAASDYVVIPISADRYSILGLKMLIDTIAETKNKLNSKLELAGLLICKYEGRQNIDQDFEGEAPVISQMTGARVFDTRIRKNVKCRESQTARMPLGAYSPRCNAEKDYEAFARELIEIGER